jgi:uncharacterized protein
MSHKLTGEKMDSKTKLFAVFILIIVGGLLYYYLIGAPLQDAADGKSSVEENKFNSSEIANPASVNCLESSGTPVMRTDSEGGEYGVCVFSSGAECEEWAYYRGECFVKTEALLGKEFTLWVGSIAQLSRINLELKVLNLADNNSAVTIKAAHAGKESELKINKDAAVTFEGYSIKVASIILKEGAAGNKPNDYKIRLMASKVDKPADNSCVADSDCAIKDIGNLCGKYLDCVNKDYVPVPPEINSDFCGYPEIDGCKCIDGGCIGTIAGKTNIN